MSHISLSQRSLSLSLTHTRTHTRSVILHNTLQLEQELRGDTERQARTRGRPQVGDGSHMLTWPREVEPQLAAQISDVPSPRRRRAAAAHSRQAKTAGCRRRQRRWTVQRQEWFYLQRRHDIPCRLHLATERCSPCRCPTASSASTAQARAARNPIGLPGSSSPVQRVRTVAETDVRHEEESEGEGQREREGEEARRGQSRRERERERERDGDKESESEPEEDGGTKVCVHDVQQVWDAVLGSTHLPSRPTGDRNRAPSSSWLLCRLLCWLLRDTGEDGGQQAAHSPR